jgi:hypothetical protein
MAVAPYQAPDFELGYGNFPPHKAPRRGFARGRAFLPTDDHARVFGSAGIRPSS